jgi:hypothetical protein
MAQYLLSGLYEFDGSVAALGVGGITSLNVLSNLTFAGDASLSSADNTASSTDTDLTIQFEGDTEATAANYIGGGIIATLIVSFPIRVVLDGRELYVLEVTSGANAGVYFYVPEDLPLASGLLNSIELDANISLNLGTASDGIVNGDNTGEDMDVGYIDGDGDVITNEADTINGNDGDDTITAGGGNDVVDGGNDNDVINGGTGDDSIDGGAGDDALTGGDGDDTFVYTSGQGADTITDFGNDTGDALDGDATNNDFVDLTDFYNASTLAAVNAVGTDSFTTELGMLKADQADGTLDGNINGTDYSAIIAGINLRLELGGTAVASTELTAETTGVICFGAGTLITTKRGAIPIELLLPDDRILTMDNGYKPVRWLGNRTVRATGKNAPIHIPAGALGNERELVVSPNHRMWIRSAEAELMLGDHEVLVPAKFLVGHNGITQQRGGLIGYHHMLFDQHEIVFAEGCPSESFHPGMQAMDTLSQASKDEILELFPELAHVDGEGMQMSALARQSVKAHEAPLLLM